MQMPIDRIEATYTVVTPMFCGGARPEKAELRLPSFKGVLRWFWRATAWAKYAGDLARIQSVEDLLFGSARRGQGKVVMRFASPLAKHLIALEKGSLLRKSSLRNANIVGDGARYLGYGVVEAYSSNIRGVNAGQLIRGCVQAPFEFTVELRCRDLDPPLRDSLLVALRAIGLMGGMGAKSRRGYGSLVLEKLAVNGVTSGWSRPTSPTELAVALRALYSPGADANGLPSFTALSSRSRHVVLPAFGKTDSLALLDQVGREMMRFRSWGRGGFVLGEESEKRFKDDHDLMNKLLSARTVHPRRIVFGLPHDYGKPPEKKVGPASDDFERRASPLLIHIHRCGDVPVAVLSFLPADFLPQKSDEPAKVSVGGAEVPVMADPELWRPIEGLLDRFLGTAERKGSFGEAVGVRYHDDAR